MKSLSPVVWFEGMYLGPHQFQAQNRYVEDSIHFATSALWSGNYGLIGGELSAEALANGQALLLHARGLFPDGLPFDMPAADKPPPPRDLTAIFPLTENQATLYLAVPPARPNACNYSTGGTQPSGARFLSENQPLCDETTGGDERPVPLARKNIQLLLETEELGDLVRLPIARLVRSGAGSYTLDPAFVPPSIDITASPRLLTMLGRLIQSLDDRAAGLSLAKGEQPGQAPRDLVRFWFLNTLNSSLAPLKHLYSVRRGHPEQLFLEMSKLAGALCTYALDSHPRTLPLYDHGHLGDCFEALDAHIRRHLNIILPEPCLRIPLQPAAAQYFYRGEVVDARCLGPSTWILAVRGGAPEHELIANIPLLAKMCSEQFVPRLVQSALPGFVLTHLPTPPPAISTRAGTQYFTVNKSGPCWEHIRKTSQVGLYIPGDIANPELELLVVID